MDLIAALRGFAIGRPHVLVVPTVGGAAVRLAVEAELCRRGWPAAWNPADADVLLVAGRPGPRLTEAVDSVWRQVPAPRTRVQFAGVADLAGGLEAALAQLRGPPPLDAHNGREGHDEHGEPDHHGGAQGQGQRGVVGAHGVHSEHGSHGGHGSPGEHGAHGGGMGMPGGRPMADLGADRDGLYLDRLHVPVGPVLPDWPAGLVARLTLQGDVVQEADVEVLDAASGSSFWDDGDRLAARELDSLGRLLAVAGWDDAAARARRLRDDLLAGVSPHRVAGRATPLLRRVGRSRTLRWLVRGIDTGAGDVADWLQRRLRAVEVALEGEDPRLPRVAVEQLPSLLVGAELAAVRLIVAAVDPDTDAAIVPPSGEADPDEARHG